MSSSSSSSIREQRVAFAYEQVAGWRRVSEGDFYADAGKGPPPGIVKRLKSLPVELRAQGLSLTLAVLLGKGTGDHRKIVHALAVWLLDEAPRKPLAGIETGGSLDRDQHLLEVVVRADRASYLAAQREALDLVEELKVLAETLLT